MDQFKIWKKYARAAEGALVGTDYADAEFSVHRTDARGAAAARWSWICGSPELSSEEWPDGLVLEWSSATGWGFGAQRDDRLVPLPVPVLAAPQAIVALLPALMDGRRGQFPASENQWEHAAAIASWAEAASVYGDGKYGDAYQRAEEEAANFLHWQTQLDGALPDEPVRPSAGLGDTEASTGQSSEPTP